MTTTYFRVQTADRDVTELLDPGHQFSRPWNGAKHLVRQGVSACVSLDELAEYLECGMAGAFTVRDGGWVVVEMEAEEIPGSCPVDGEYEVLVRPSRIVSATPVGDEFIALLDEKAAFFSSFCPNDFDDED